MNGKRIVIAGAGFGGLSTANELRRLLGEQHRIIIVDRKNAFYVGFTLLWVMTGERSSIRAGERSILALREKGIDFINEEIISIDPRELRVTTERQVLHADFLVVALGADLSPNAVPGFGNGAYNLYSSDGAEALQSALKNFGGGRIAVLISRTPFKCPPAPYEAAFLIDWLMRQRGIRERVAINVYTPEPFPMPTAGPSTGARITEMLAQTNIGFHPKKSIQHVNPERKVLVFSDTEEAYDLLVGIPPHSAPEVVQDAKLTDESGWVPVDRFTMKTRFDRVYVIGDTNIVPLGEGRFLPKAGVFAAAQGKVLAENIAAELTGKEPFSRFDGKGHCWIELGGGLAALGEGDYYASPNPQVTIKPPSADYRRAKQEYEQQILREWLG